ncbi:hypothetical protein [Clostridium beijerinckii]|nr:hypothetical protein [Clostridium beijerinckii]
MEVSFGLADSLGYIKEEFLKARYKKRQKRMRFRKGIGLETIE